MSVGLILRSRSLRSHLVGIDVGDSRDVLIRLGEGIVDLDLGEIKNRRMIPMPLVRDFSHKAV